MASPVTGPASSIGSPLAVMMRASVPTPTGTWIGASVSATGWPRTRPSVESMAMQRTVDSPRCWATSRTRRWPLLVVSSAFRISGRCPSNWTSTTAPITCATRPVGLAMMFSSRVAVVSDDGQLDRHIVSGGPGIGADRVGILDQRTDLVLVGAGNGNLQFDREREAGLVLLKRHLAGDLGGRAVDAVLLAERQDGLAIAGGIAEREELLGIVALARAAELLRERHGER